MDGWCLVIYLIQGGGYLGGYGPFPAPNGGPGFSSLDNVIPGPNGGAQYLNVYSDYNNPEHIFGNFVEANVFQERILTAADIGRFYSFTFDHVTALPQFAPNPTDPNFKETAVCVKVVDPNTLALVHFNTFNTANDNMWTEGSSITGTIDGAWEGYILQFEFLAASTQYAPTGVYYDNVTFVIGAAIPTLSEWGLITMTLLLFIVSVCAMKWGYRNRKIITATI
ncbi:MAG: IPTL-CTERM sorting domain-containing protein [Saprospiraceae bacterium]|nr:IPTL-CTERM sorting domain-containing protein [Saprospiraceae bacterium]